MNRKRMHIRVFGVRKSWCIRIFLFLFFLAIIFLSVDSVLQPAIRSIAESNSVYFAMKAINDAVYQKLGQEGIRYRDIITLEKDQTGKITALHTDIVKVNSLKAEISDLVLDELHAIDTSVISIPIGNALGVDFLSGKGPKIPIEIIPLGFVSTACVSDFSSAGINQTKHRVSMTVSVRISILMPLDRVSTVVTSDIPVAETILVGEVPESYTNIMDTRDLIEQGIDYAME